MQASEDEHYILHIARSGRKGSSRYEIQSLRNTMESAVKLLLELVVQYCVVLSVHNI